MEERYSAVTHDELVEVEGPEYVFPEQNPQVMIFKPTILQSSTAGTKRVMEIAKVSTLKLSDHQHRPEWQNNTDLSDKKSRNK